MVHTSTLSAFESSHKYCLCYQRWLPVISSRHAVSFVQLRPYSMHAKSLELISPQTKLPSGNEKFISHHCYQGQHVWHINPSLPQAERSACPLSSTHVPPSLPGGTGESLLRVIIIRCLFRNNYSKSSPNSCLRFS